MSGITVDDLPGRGIDLATVADQAAAVRKSGAAAAAAGTAAMTSWGTLPKSYRSTGADRLFDVMTPVGADTDAIGVALAAAAGALEQYADDAKPTLAKIAALAEKVAAFQASATADYPKSAPLTALPGSGVPGGQGPTTPSLTYAGWEDDPAAQQVQHDLQVSAAALEAELLGHQQVCATAIRAAAGLPPAFTTAVQQAQASLTAEDGYWSADWAASLHRSGAEGPCAKTEVGFVHSLWKAGVDVLDGLNDTAGLLGADFEHGKFFDGDVLGSAWSRMNDLVVAVDPVVVVPAFIDGMWGPAGATRDEDREQVGRTLGLGLGIVSLSPPKQWWNGESWAEGWGDGTVNGRYRADAVQASAEALLGVVPVIGSLKYLRILGAGRDADAAAAAARAFGEGDASAARAALDGLSERRLIRAMHDMDPADAARLREVLREGPLQPSALHDLDGRSLDRDLDRLDDQVHDREARDRADAHHGPADPEDGSGRTGRGRGGAGSAPSGGSATGSAATTSHGAPGTPAPPPRFTPRPHAYGPEVRSVTESTPPAAFPGRTPNQLGVIGEKLTAQDLKDRGLRIVAEQAQVQVPGSTAWFKPDFIAADQHGHLVLVESKFGPHADFTPNQRRGYSAFDAGPHALRGRSPATNQALREALIRDGIDPNDPVVRVEVYRWNVDIVPSAALRAAAGVP